MVEMLVVTAVGTAFILGLMNTTMMTQRQGTRNENRGDWKSLLSFMNTTFSNGQQCTNFFQNIKFKGGLAIPLPSLGIVKAPSAVAVDTSVQSPPALNVSNYATEFLQVGSTLSGFCTTGIQLLPMPGGSQVISPGVNKYQVYLSIRAKQMQGTIPVGVATSAPNMPACTLANVLSGAIQPDLSSGGFTGTSPAVLSPDTISFVVYTALNSKGNEVISGCSATGDAVTNTCQSYDGSTTLAANGKCVINSLNMNSANTLPAAVLNFSGTSPALSIQSNGTEVMNLGTQTTSTPGAPGWVEYVSGLGVTSVYEPTVYASQAACCNAGLLYHCGQMVLPSGKTVTYFCQQTGTMPGSTVSVTQASFPGDVAITGNMTVAGAPSSLPSSSPSLAASPLNFTTSGNITAGNMTTGNITLKAGSNLTGLIASPLRVIGGGFCGSDGSSTLLGSATCSSSHSFTCPQGSQTVITSVGNINGQSNSGGLCTVP